MSHHKRGSNTQKNQLHCPQSARYHTGVQNQQLLDVNEIIGEKQKLRKRVVQGAFLYGR